MPTPRSLAIVGGVSARFLPVPFPVDAFGPCMPGPDGRAARIVVSNGKVSTELDLATGAATAVPGGHARVRTDPALGLGGLRERVRETPHGPRTELFAPESPDVVLGSVEGELIASARTGALVLLGVAMPGTRYDLVALALGARAPELRLPGAFAAALAAEGPYAIAATPNGTLHAFRLDAAGLASISIATPAWAHVDARLVGGEALVLTGRTLVLARLDAMPFVPGAHHAIAVSYAPIVGHARGLREPGVVVATVGQKILVDHPEVRRLTIERAPDDPPVRSGDKIRIDDVREPLPGILKVHAWSKGDGLASVRPPPPPLELPAPDVRPLTSALGGATAAPRPRNREVMQKLAASWGFAVPPALDAFLEATDTDPVLCRWLTRLGLEYVDVRTLSADWNADPCVLGFAGRGNGDAPALYLYPPALASGAEPIVVEYWHETNECSFVARTFDEFLGAMLAEQEREEPELVALVRERLRIAPRKVLAGAPPDWLAHPDAAAPPLDEIEAREARGDLLGAERGWAQHYVAQGPNEARARDALKRLYAALGWHAALDALARAAGEL